MLPEIKDRPYVEYIVLLHVSRTYFTDFYWTSILQHRVRLDKVVPERQTAHSQGGTS